jgi:hypothetical protein
MKIIKTAFMKVNPIENSEEDFYDLISPVNPNTPTKRIKAYDVEQNYDACREFADAWNMKYPNHIVKIYEHNDLREPSHGVEMGREIHDNFQKVYGISPEQASIVLAHELGQNSDNTIVNPGEQEIDDELV